MPAARSLFNDYIMGRLIDLTGRVFGRLTVLRQLSERDHLKRVIWHCRCTCGKEIDVNAGHLTSGHTTSCGCSRRAGIIGKRFGKLVVLGYSDRRTESGLPLYKCKCDCGNIKETTANHLLMGDTKSCGCWVYERIQTEVAYPNDTYRHLSDILSGIKQRCYNPNGTGYRNYGCRGIYVCEEWLNSALSFIEWSLSNGYRKGLTIDRIDNDGPYAPWNCRWVDKYIQNGNKRSNRYITINGVTHIAEDWITIFHLPQSFRNFSASHTNEESATWIKDFIRTKTY